MAPSLSSTDLLRRLGEFREALAWGRNVLTSCFVISQGCFQTMCALCLTSQVSSTEVSHPLFQFNSLDRSGLCGSWSRMGCNPHGGSRVAERLRSTRLIPASEEAASGRPLSSRPAGLHNELQDGQDFIVGPRLKNKREE